MLSIVYIGTTVAAVGCELHLLTNPFIMTNTSQ